MKIHVEPTDADPQPFIEQIMLSVVYMPNSQDLLKKLSEEQRRKKMNVLFKK